MKIAIDCRYLGKSGIGRVCRGILDNLDYSLHQYFLIGDPAELVSYTRAEVIADASNPFSKKGLFSYVRRVNGECDCLIIPNFIIPYGIKIPVYTIVHDLIFLDLPDITTKGFIDYGVKKMLLKRCMKKSVRIACVSAFTQSRCEHYFPKYAHKCYVNYVGLSKEVLGYRHDGTQKKNLIVFVGNVKAHKGLRTLIEAFRMLPKGKFRLKIIGEREGFLVGMDSKDLQSDDVIFTGRLSDEELLGEIASAKFLVQPSLYEGFGVPPMEALYLGTRPIISDIPVFKEIYSGLPVTFFKVSDSQDLANKLLGSISDAKVQSLEINQKFSYKLFTDKLLSNVKS